MIGDVVGEPGLKIIEKELPGIIKDNNVDFTVVNGENSADGFGMSEESLKRIMAGGADVVTSGNHVWEKRPFWQILETNDVILRPANYPVGTPGRGWLCLEKNNIAWIVINLQGRELMTAIDCPFSVFDKIVKSLSNSASKYHSLFDHDMNSILSNVYPVIIVDFHAESSREKEALGHYINGRAALMAGTHTHVQTADEQILSKGTVYISDLGMTGISDSVIGMDAKICLERTRKQVLYRMEPATQSQDGSENKTSVQGIIAEIDIETGKGISVRRL